MKAKDAIFTYQLLLMPILLTLESKPPEHFSIQLCKPATIGQQWRRLISTLALQSCPHLTHGCKVITLGISGFNLPCLLLEFYLFDLIDLGSKF